MADTKKPNKVLPNLDNDAKITLGILSCFSATGILLLSIVNKAGTFGNYVGAFTATLFGKGAILLPIAFFLAGMILIKLQKNQELREDLSGRLVWGMAFIIASFNGFLSVIMKVGSWDEASQGGGVVGFALHSQLLQIFGQFGTYIILFTILIMGFFMISNMTFVDFLTKMGQTIKDPGKFMDLVPDLFEFWRSGGKKQSEIVKGMKNEGKAEVTKKSSTNTKKEEVRDKVSQKASPKENEKTKDPIFRKEEKIIEIEPIKATKKAKKPTFSFSDSSDGITDFQRNDSHIDWTLPPFDILKQSKTEPDAGDIESNKEIIKDTLAHFGIKVEMHNAVVGPTVTQYTLKPANGVRLSTIDKLQRDLALALAAQNIRIEAPIPGKSLVGIEVPNKTKSEVRIRDLLQTNEFINSDELTVGVGKNVAGKNVFSPVTSMPHLLVAGATGAGKSVWINSLLLSLLYKYPPTELQLVLVDMKRVELKLYDEIPHLLSNVITDSEKAINALKWTLLEMDKRYKILEEHGKRNVKDYNFYAERKDLEPLPYLIFVIDELADLMMMARSEVEPIIVRLTQMSRAVGIHLILGTQRPDTSVVTGLIKANVPTRIAFAVASQIDSRVIIDTNGAEKLLGKGDGLLISPSSMHAMRFQGPNVDEIEVRRCVDFLKRQKEENPELDNVNNEIIEPPKSDIKIPGLEIKEDSEDSESIDESFEEAKKIVVKYQKASASFLQQIMGIGYPKAAKIVMQLEEKGIVGPQNGSKPRDVYLKPEDLEKNTTIKDEE